MANAAPRHWHAFDELKSGWLSTEDEIDMAMCRRSR